MQMFANDPQYIVEDMLKGYAKAHSDIVPPRTIPECSRLRSPSERARLVSLPAAAPAISPRLSAMWDAIWWMP